MKHWVALMLGLACMLQAAQAQAPVLTSPNGLGTSPPPPWHVVGMPRQSKPFTRFDVVEFEGQRTLRVESDHAYANLVHPLSGVRAGMLSWRWRVDEPVHGADLRQRSGDDAALKVCASFDLPRERVPFLERQVLRVIESQASEPLPNATLCYVWDATLASGTLLHNAFTHRIRFIVVHGTPRRWSDERHDLAADFARAFGDEAASVPPVIGVAVGADSDNTGSHSVGYLDSLVLGSR